ncbi:Na+/H+ antiporter NhaC family protein [Microvirga lotononidis]|uniref:Na+/H+ antiporter n=1 Tax=Microvirga lotononidis TaxID=864069 RepID=I4Z1Z9_9HYPH|nr:Na+/H+ antiporter NhaC family protein [Microvirga lotononidis]EIM30241.1 Na+/H+ antiporter [Microvirga lotononidis]WQO31541.1 Na+/H+ antiporter NhaC family protein [Microvirga lotononidis]
MTDETSLSGRVHQEPSYLDAILPIVALAVLIGGAMALFGLAATEGPLQVALILAAMIAALIGLGNGHRWEDVEAVGRRGMASMVGVTYILLATGALIGTWNLSGTIPTLVFYGLRLFHPDWFYLAAAMSCAVLAFSIGSTWATAGTVGVGLMGLATLVGVSPVITAGAVISGTFFGAKLSPRSPSTVLVAELTGNTMPTHLCYQAKTSAPTFILAIVIFAILGLADGTDGAGDAVIASELAALDTLFRITPLNLLPLVLLFALSAFGVPASLAIMAAALFAGLMAPVLQPNAVLTFVGSTDLGTPAAFLKGVWQAMATGYQANSGIPAVDGLLTRGGMDSMLMTIWLILGALTYGSLLKEFGLLSKLVMPTIRMSRTPAQLIAAVAVTAFALNVIVGDRYVAVILPARLFRDEFERRGIPGTSLSHTIADAGTVTSPLVPWNSCGAYMAAVLGIPTLLYLPFCFFNIASPLLALALAFKAARRP